MPDTATLLYRRVEALTDLDSDAVEVRNRSLHAALAQVCHEGVKDTGMAFGMLGGRPYLLATLTAGVMIALFVYLRKKRLPGYAWAGFGLILGGAAGNLFDRLAYGYVIDMLEPLFARLFVFNPADAAVVCGAVLLGVYLLFGKEDTPDERA